MKAARRPIAELTEKEKEKKRREWRLAKKKQKEGGVTKPKNNKCCALNARLCEKLKKRITDQKKVIDNILLKKHALQKNLYRHKIKIEELRKLISNSERTENKYLINSSESKTNSEFVPTDINAPTTSSGLTTTDKSENEDLREKTPMSNTLSFINENIPSISTPEKNKVKKQILQLNVISASLQTAYEKHDNKSKQILKDIVSSEAIEKYNLKTDISKSLGLKGRVRKFQKKERTYKEAKEIRIFFNRDDNTRMTAGKKECVGRGNDKLQKRFLLTSLKKLYTKYVSEGGKASFSTFRRNRPRNVLRPKLSDRNTVACIKHSNLAFKVAHLKKIGVIGTSDLQELLASSVCSVESYDCMYLNCEKCKDTNPEMNLTDITNNTECTWIQWIRKEFTFEKGIERKITTTKKYAKESIKGTFSELKEMFLADLRAFRQHFFNINHQHKKYREVIDNLLPNEAALIIDFSENYSFSEINIRDAQNQIPNDLDPVPLTTRLHQITYHVPSTTLRYRNVSCFCKSSLPRGICECYNAKTHVLKKTIVHKINCSTNVSKRMRNNEEAGQLNECGAVLPEIPVVSHRISTNDIDVIHDEGGIFQSKTKASSCIIRETAGTKIVLMAKNQNSLNINTNVLTNVKQKPKIISQVIIPPSKCTPKIVTNNENKENLSSLNTKNYDRLKRKTRKEIKRKDKKLKRKKEEDESSNSDIAMSVHSDSDICDVASESDSLDMQDTDFNINKSKSKGCKKNVKVKIEKTKTCLIPDTMLHQPSSSSNLEIVPIDIKKYDYVLVRHFLKKRVEYFVGTVLEKPFNDKVKISFLRKVGKHDNTKFIKTKSMEVELIDCKNIVKTVELMSINENETDFVFLDDDDYIYFD
ncbi:unnamed protein product [Parnassius apollo]|uniref:(apollo) hypothetical protein n=1 Tax=Parnassius apollo TaxID=110799 RepID=A0A8S3XRF4_PARAO|nr:unnamed protein product [Parnassius apollo]